MIPPRDAVAVAVIGRLADRYADKHADWVAGFPVGGSIWAIGAAWNAEIALRRETEAATRATRACRTVAALLACSNPLVREAAMLSL